MPKKFTVKNGGNIWDSANEFRCKRFNNTLQRMKKNCNKVLETYIQDYINEHPEKLEDLNINSSVLLNLDSLNTKLKDFSNKNNKNKFTYVRIYANIEREKNKNSSSNLLIEDFEEKGKSISI